MNRTASVSAALLFLPLLGGSAAAKPKVSGATVGPTVVPETTMFLRNAFDADPTDYIGNFVMQDGVPPIPDESNAAPLTCSRFVTWAAKDGGGVHYTETFAATASASLKVGVPPFAAGSASAQAGTEVLIDYTLTKKWVPVVSDPAGFSACCAQYPSECKPWYVGEFIGGTGKIYYAKSSSSKGGAHVVTTQVGADVLVSGGKEWVRGFEFPNEVAFAFKLRRSPIRDSSAGNPVADAWDGVQKPTGPEGEYFVGTSPVTNAESVSREQARLDAMKQAVMWCSSTYTYSNSGSQTAYGNAAAMQSTGTVEHVDWETAAGGTLKELRDVAWKVDSRVGEMGDPQVAVRGLFLLPAASIPACRVAPGTRSDAPPSGSVTPSGTVAPSGTALPSGTAAPAPAPKR